MVRRIGGLYINGENRHSKGIHSYSVQNFESVGDVVNSHEGWEVLFSCPGRPNGVEIELGGQRFDLDTSPMLVFNGREDHHEFYHAKNSGVYALLLRDSFINDRLGGRLKAADFVFTRPEVGSAAFSTLVRDIFDTLRGETASGGECDAMADALLFAMLDEVPHDHAKQIETVEKQRLNSFLVKDAVSLIHNGASRAEFDLDELSQFLGVTKFHLIRTFKKVTGLTPHQYLLSVRLAKANRKIQNSTDSISSIAAQSGFDDLSTFSKAFRKRFGRTPTSFRR